VAQRIAVRALQARFKLSERRACALVGLGRSNCRYRPRREDWPALRERLRTLAGERRRFGYRRLYVLLRREGFIVISSASIVSTPRRASPFVVAAGGGACPAVCPGWAYPPA
jgi:hypothetical protein